MIKADLGGYHEPFWKTVFFVPGLKYTFYHRLCFYFSQRKVFFPIFFLLWLYMKHLSYLYGIQTDWSKALPPQIVIAHFGTITFFPRSCGKNCKIRQGVTVGHTDNSKHGAPIIGDNVSFGANSIAIGDITIGNNVIIAAGAVVTKSIPDNCVVGGVPAKIIKQNT